MKLLAILTSMAIATGAQAQSRGAAFGFAAGTTGGGTVTPVYPTTNAQ